MLTALAKLPADRFATAAEFARGAGAAAGAEATGGIGADARGPSGAPADRPWLALSAALARSDQSLAVRRVGARAAPHAEPPRSLRFGCVPAAGSQVAFPVGRIATYLALSPDGRQAVYAASHGDRRWSLDIRNLADLEARTLPGTEGATYPGVLARRTVDRLWRGRRQPEEGRDDGTGLTTLPARSPPAQSASPGLSGPGDRLCPDESRRARPVAVPADGGQPVRFTRFDSATRRAAPARTRAADGGRLIFYSSTRRAIWTSHRRSCRRDRSRRRCCTGLRGARALGLVGRVPALRARRRRARWRRRSTRARSRLAPRLQILDSIAARAAWTAPAALSASGSLLYQRGGAGEPLVRRGPARRAATSCSIRRGCYAHPRLSPDGRRLAVEVRAAAAANLGGRPRRPAPRSGSPARGSTTGPSGRPTAAGSSTARAGHRARRSGGSPPTAAGRPSWCTRGRMPFARASSRRDGRSLVFRADTPRQQPRHPALPLAGQRGRGRLLTHRTTTSIPGSRPTRGGWRICRTRRAAKRCTCGRSRGRAAWPCRAAGAASRSGPAMAGSSIAPAPRSWPPRSPELPCSPW